MPADSVKYYSETSRTYSTIYVGRAELHDIVIPKSFDSLLALGKEIEITLTSSSSMSLTFGILGAILLVIGEMLDRDDLAMVGLAVFTVGMIYWVTTLINAGHEIYSIKFNNELYRSGEGFEYEDTTAVVSHGLLYAADSSLNVPSTGVERETAPVTGSSVHGIEYDTAPVVGRASPAIQPEPVLPAAKVPEQFDFSRITGKNKIYVPEVTRDGVTGSTPILQGRNLGVSRLVCPKCGAEALVSSGTSIICGNCRVLMQAEV